MIKLNSPISATTLYSDKVYIDYYVEENSKFTSKIVFVLDGVKHEKTDLFGNFVVDNLEPGDHFLRCYLVNKSGNIIIGSEKKIKFKTDDNVIFLKNRLSDIVFSQIPSFVREEYEMFVVFLEKYYQFLEQSNDPTKTPLNQFEFADVNYTPEVLLEKFKKLFIPDFPQDLTIDVETGEPLNIRNLIKRASQFYQSKGTEKSINFLFKILYDTQVDIFYPRTEMMIVSGGLWIERKTIKILVSNNEKKLRSLIGKQIYQKNASGIKTNFATVVTCDVYSQSPYKVAELELKEIFGNFTDGKIYCDLVYEDANVTFSFDLRRGIQNIQITDGGTNYKEGDIVQLVSIDNTSGVAYRGIVSKVDDNGTILKISTVNFGINYEINSNSLYGITVTTVGGSGASGSPQSTIMCEYDGYYRNSKSILGAKNFLQDNYYYQTHSYEILSDVPYEKFKDPITRLAHPAGYKMFGRLTFKPRILSNPSSLNNVTVLRSNFIGNYIAYRASSDVDLRDENNDLFPNGFNPDQPIPPQTGVGDFVHNPLGLPINTQIKNASYSYERTLPVIPDINQKRNYWVVFPHPNKDLNTNETIGSFFELTIQDMAIEVEELKAGDEF